MTTSDVSGSAPCEYEAGTLWSNVSVRVGAKCDERRFRAPAGCTVLPCRRSVLLSSVVFATTSCNRGRATNQPIRLVLAGTPAILAYLPHTLAQQLDFYRNEGLRLEIDAVPGGTKGVQALLGGSADVVVGYYDHAIRMAAQRQAIRSFVTMTRYPGNIVVTSAARSKSTRTIEDLKKCVVGVSDLGSQSHLFLNYLLVRHGLTPSDVTAMPTGSQSAAIAALEHGNLDAWSGFDPGVTQFRRRHPLARILANVSTGSGVRSVFGVNAYPGSVLYTRAEWLERNPGDAARLTRAILKGLRYIQEHSPEQIMEVVPDSHLGEDRAVYREALGNARAAHELTQLFRKWSPVGRCISTEAASNVAGCYMRRVWPCWNQEVCILRSPVILRLCTFCNDIRILDAGRFNG